MSRSLQIFKFSIFWEILPFYGQLEEWYSLLSRLCKKTKEVWIKNLAAFKIWGKDFKKTYSYRVSNNIVKYFAIWPIQSLRKNILKKIHRIDAEKIANVISKIMNKMNKNMVLAISPAYVQTQDVYIENKSLEEFELDFKTHKDAIRKEDVKNIKESICSLVNLIDKTLFDKVGFLKTENGYEQITIKNWYPLSFIKWYENFETSMKYFNYEIWNHPFDGLMIMNKYPDINDTKQLQMCYKSALNLGDTFINIINSMHHLERLILSVDFSCHQKSIPMNEFIMLLSILKQVNKAYIKNDWVCIHEESSIIKSNLTYTVKTKCSIALVSTKQHEYTIIKISNGYFQTDKIICLNFDTLSDVYYCPIVAISQCEKIEIINVYNKEILDLIEIAKSKRLQSKMKLPFIIFHLPELRDYKLIDSPETNCRVNEIVNNDMIEISLLRNTEVNDEELKNSIRCLPKDINVWLRIGSSIESRWVNNQEIINLLLDLNIKRTEFIFLINRDFDTYLMQRLREQESLCELDVFLWIASQSNFDILENFSKNSKSLIHYKTNDQEEMDSDIYLT